MHFHLSLNSNNQAMVDDPTGETARLLRAVAQGVLAGSDGGKLHDSNGNTVGSWSFDPGEDETPCKDCGGFPCSCS